MDVVKGNIKLGKKERSELRLEEFHNLVNMASIKWQMSAFHFLTSRFSMIDTSVLYRKSCTNTTLITVTTQKISQALQKHSLTCSWQEYVTQHWNHVFCCWYVQSMRPLMISQLSPTVRQTTRTSRDTATHAPIRITFWMGEEGGTHVR